MNFMDCKTETDQSLLLIGVPFKFKYFINPWRGIQVAIPGQVRLWQLQEQCSLFLPACAVFFHVAKQWYGCQYGFLYMWTDVDVHHCTVGLRVQRKRVCAESWPWDINPLPSRASNLCQYCTDAWRWSYPTAKCATPILLLTWLTDRIKKVYPSVITSMRIWICLKV